MNTCEPDSYVEMTTEQVRARVRAARDAWHKRYKHEVKKAREYAEEVCNKELFFWQRWRKEKPTESVISDRARLVLSYAFDFDSKSTFNRLEAAVESAPQSKMLVSSKDLLLLARTESSALWLE